MKEEDRSMTQQAGSKVDITLQGGMRFEALNADGISISLDASPAHGGTGQGFGPMQLLLAGLGGCTAMDVISILRKKRQDVTGYRVEVTGYQNGEHPRKFNRIEIKHILSGNNLSDEAVKRSIELSEAKYCPAFAMLEHAARISSTCEIHSPDLQSQADPDLRPQGGGGPAPQD